MHILCKFINTLVYLDLLLNNLEQDTGICYDTIKKNCITHAKKMESRKHRGLNSLCRTCLQVLSDEEDVDSWDVQPNIKHEIFKTPELAKKLIVCTGLDVALNDEYPNQLCDCCFNRVNEFHQFRTMCVESMERFRNISQTFEDEKPIFDFNSHVKTEIMVDETIVSFQNDTKNEDVLSIEEEMAKSVCGKKKPAIDRSGVSRRESTKNKKTSMKAIVEKENSDLRCELSGESTNDNAQFKDVTNNTGPKIRLQCDICPAFFYKEEILTAHKREHDGQEEFRCPYEKCNKVYKNRRYFTDHLGAHKRSYLCEICGKVYLNACGLKEHSYSHKDKSELPFPCDQPNCSSAFTTKDNLKIHLLRHNGIKNFVCMHCGERKTTITELKKHINTHTRERTYPCRVCARVFHSSGKLWVHVRTIHERIKNYACRYCDRTFAKSYTRKNHEMTHTGERPHKCPKCDKCFTQRGALKTHLKTH